MEQTKCETCGREGDIIANKVLEAMRRSVTTPAMGFTISVEGESRLVAKNSKIFTQEEIVAKLHEASLSYNICDVDCQPNMFTSTMLVQFQLTPSGDGTANIDADMIEDVMGIIYHGFADPTKNYALYPFTIYTPSPCHRGTGR